MAGRGIIGATDSGPQERRLRVDEALTLRTLIWAGDGRKAPFVLLHGILSNALVWQDVAIALQAEGHTVVAVDLPGHGRSTKPDTGYEFPALIRDIRVVIEGLRLFRPVLVGHSWGASIALECAVDRPDLVRGLVLADGGLDAPRDRYPDRESFVESLALPPLDGVTRVRLEGYLRKVNPGWSDRRVDANMASFAKLADGSMSLRVPPAVRLAILAALWDERPVELYQRLRVPVILAPSDTGDAAWTELKRTAITAASVALDGNGVAHRERWFTSDHDIPGSHPIPLADLLVRAAASFWV